MTRRRGRVAILGGGMAGLSAAWRLSEPGWRDRFESITVYQRGWRLGGKGASSRGPHGRIEEHGLHVWLGCYDNAFALLRECYAELDRPTTDPDCPIQTWEQAFGPSQHLGIADRFGADWLVWPGEFAPTSGLPGEPDSTGREFTAVDFVRRALGLVRDFAASLDGDDDTAEWLDVVRYGVTAVLAALATPGVPQSITTDPLNRALEAVRAALDYENRPAHRRVWLFLSLETATARGIIADNLVTDPRGFRAINDEDFCAWILRHGAHPDVLDFPLIRGLYDMVFGYQDGDFDRPAFAAGVALLLTGIALFQYRGAFFWKMTAGMGDVVIAPLYQALRRRGVRFEFFHRVDALHLDDRRQAIEAVTVGRQAHLADGVDEYQPLVRVGGLPVFPDRPLADQLAAPVADDLESHFGVRADVETRVLRRGVDFDHVVLAASLGMVELISGELIADSPQWREMCTHIRTVATQAFQLWLRPEESELGWTLPGVTTSGYVSPFDTWASMPQTLWAEQWPDPGTPRTVGYFCGALAAPWPPPTAPDAYVAACRQAVFDAAVDYLDNHVGLYLPGAVTEGGFAWDLLVGADGRVGADALATQHVSVNIDPSDRYVQSVPGSDRYRLRSDESGYDNLVLAGDWTDSGFNAGCIEAAVASGLQAANALLGRGHRYRIRGFYLP
ncbi:15-cis-phytoene desaturase [Mycolicibacterium phlei]|uniref:Amine oxidase n=1 Tax=Mycolicibacterium phlei DSM 43239 = CCUG 21000 TaxID=1226750 RepID=A0A5N5UQJ0_MYCPH|nr:FAD-dependent oxidoreductase [Mycolicibacterium phlei]VEG08332.1 15-cis-phytoene desaturase [Mycobacteroides chelonae]AMO60212.1 15-cis-phytoene desaturase [Mycolicibacterium phlei]KAB7751862.1 amine oxidase [Mycolicibacterium phlei DSM 43239 = CCUG 21000]KXW60450.1 amine oxidase [Mycolicibacterium phlei DSM 43239 = CCUG 21000]KXW66482.1 amine oxidase [Mycolicibacterium phlei DSM 43072]